MAFSKPVNEQRPDRVMALEGLRGVAAISVVLYHFLVLVFPAMYYGSSTTQHNRLEDNLHGNPLMAFISGDFAVSTFFVLSGFVLSVGFFASQNTSILRSLAIRRYIRLMIPALASVIIAWLFIVSGTSFIHQAFAITNSSALNLSWDGNTSLLNALYEGTIGVFTQESTYGYNSVLWTMRYEFLGSFIVFVTAALFGKSRYRTLVYAILFIALFNTWFIGFILGMVLADIFTNRKHIIESIKLPFAVILAVVGVSLGGFPWNGVEETLYRYIQIPGFSTVQNQAVWGAIGATMLIIAIFRISFLKRVLESKLMTKIGSYTYSLYLVHQPIIYTLGMALFVFLAVNTGYTQAVALSMVGVTPAIILATVLFYKYIEAPSVRLSSTFERIMSGELQLNPFLREKTNLIKPSLRKLIERYPGESKTSIKSAVSEDE